MEQSLKERCDKVFNAAIKIEIESNPNRIGWELHPQNTQVKITNLKDIKPDEYYMRRLYLEGENYDNLFHITEGLPMWLDTYLSGRTSPKNMLEQYTIENLETMLTKMELDLVKIEQARNEFIARQKN